jgi:3-oxoadipate enol-lactonase
MSAVAAVEQPVPGPWLPPGRHVDLPGRGRTFIREMDGPPGAPTVLLLHGWTANADLNWFPAFRPLSRHVRVVAMDHRGHGRGIRSRRRFRLGDCATDASVLIDELGCGPVIAVGYSMGGPVASLLWRRHPSAVQGLVLCATSRTFASRPQERAGFLALGGIALAGRAVPTSVQRRFARQVVGSRDDGTLQAWAVEEMHRNDWTAVLEAGAALGRYDARPWMGDIDVPTAVVATLDDGLVAPARQLAMARAIPDATLHAIDGDHTVCVTRPGRFVPALLEAVGSVAERSRR